MGRNMTFLRLSPLVLALALSLSASGAAQTECPGGTFFVDLTTGQTFPATAPARVTLLSLGPTANPACAAGWHSAVLRLDLAPPCKEAEIAVEFDKPTAWTVHIADSPTNDAYGGDAGTTLNNAEMWINQQTMWVVSNRIASGDDNNL